MSLLDPTHIMQTATGFWASKVLLTAVEFDLFSTLGDRSMTAEQLGAALDSILEADTTSSMRWSRSASCTAMVMDPRAGIGTRLRPQRFSSSRVPPTSVACPRCSIRGSLDSGTAWGKR